MELILGIIMLVLSIIVTSRVLKAVDKANKTKHL